MKKQVVAKHEQVKATNLINAKNVIVTLLMALIILLVSFCAYAKYVTEIKEEVSLTFRKIKCEISLDYSEFVATSQVKATITTQENLLIEYKIDDGEWQEYTNEIYVTENCIIYGRLTDGTTAYPETSIQVESPFAQITKNGETTYYQSLGSAIQASGEEETTIIMLKDSQESVTIQEGQNIILDTNGKTLESSEQNTIINNGTLTIIGAGTISGTGESTILSNGTLTIGIKETDTPNVSVEEPTIIGEKYAIQKSTTNTGELNLYDGTVKGKEQSIVGIVNNIQPSYALNIVKDSEYEVATLSSTINYEEYATDDTLINSYTTLLAALRNSYTENIIKTISNTTENNELILEEEKTITLDLNGKTISLNGVSLTNNGLLIVKGESGELTSTVGTIINNGILNIEDSPIISSTALDTYYVITNFGQANINAGNINSTFGGISNEENGELIVDGAIIETTSIGIRNISSKNTEDEPAVKIISGNIITSSNCVVNSSTSVGLIKILNANIVSNGSESSAILNSGNGTIIIEDGNITATGTFATICNGFNSGNGAGTIDIRGGTITAPSGTGVISQEKGTVIIKGGEISGEYGARVKETGILTIGTDEETPQVTTVPTITGILYAGVCAEDEGILNFYDGKIIGPAQASIQGNVADIPDGGYIIQKTIENNIETAVIMKPNYEEVTSDGTHVVYYETLADAMLNVTSGNTIKVVNTDLTETTQPILSDNKTVVLDLNGKTVNLSDVSLENLSGTTLKITDSVGNGILRGTARVINTSGTFETYGDNEFIIESTATKASTRLIYIDVGAITTLNAGIIQYSNAIVQTGTSGRYLVDLRGVLTINGATLQAVAGNGGIYDRGVLLYDEVAKLVINSGKIQTDGMAINIAKATGTTVDNAAVTIIGGDIISNNQYGIYNQTEAFINLTGGNIIGYIGIYNITTGTIQVGETVKIEGKNGVGIRAYMGTVIVTGGTIQGATEGIIGTSANITVTEGIIIAGTIAIVNDKAEEEIQAGSVTIGINEDGTPDVKTDSPSITGGTYGIYVVEGIEFNFYDGVLVGNTNNSIRGNVANKPDGYGIQKINAEEKETATLVISNYEEYNGTKLVNTYETLAVAMQNVTDGNIIKVINANLIENNEIELPQEKTATLDLNGNTVTLEAVSITNNGTLTITAQTGEITSTVGTIINNGTLTIENEAKLSCTALNTYSAITNYGKASVNGGTINSTYRGIINEENGELIIDGATIVATNMAIRNLSNLNLESQPAIKIISGDITSLASNVINNIESSTGRIHILFANVLSQGASTPAIINCGNGTIIIEDGNIESTGSNASIYNGYNSGNGAGTIEIKGGTITSAATGVRSSEMGNVIITGGEIIAVTYGVSATNTATLTIGTNEGVPDVKTDSPIITAETYGLQASSKDTTINFYDGIIKGKTLSIYGIVNAMPTGYTLLIGEDGDYQTATLTNEFDNNYEEVDSSGTHVNYYGSLAAAFSNTVSGNTIKVIGTDITETVAPRLIYNRTVTLDLNGKIVTVDNLVSTLSGSTLKIVDTAGNGTLQRPGGILFSNNGSATLKIGTEGDKSTTSPKVMGYIYNYGNLEINSGLVTSSTTYTINNEKNLTINGGLITNTYSGTAETYTIINNNKDTINGTSNVVTNLTITGGEVQGAKNNTTYAITTGYAYTNGYINISGGKITNHIVNAKGETVISGGTINGPVTTYTGSIELTGGTINSPAYGVSATTGTITIGTNEDGTPDVKTDTPSISGSTYGVQVEEGGIINFYDGVIKGAKGQSIGGTVSGKPTDYEIQKTEEQDDEGNTKEVAILVNANYESISESTLADVVEVGDYVNYDASSNGAYTFTAGDCLTGTSISDTISTENDFNSDAVAQWRVLSVDRENGIVELMAADPTAQTVTLSGGDGFVNAETVLNNVGAIYGYGEGAESGRSITVEDVEQYSSYDPYTFVNSNSSTGYYGGTKDYTSGNFYKEIKDENGNVIGYETTTSNSVTMTQTEYNYKALNYFSDMTVYNMIFKNSTDTSSSKSLYWLASRCVYLDASVCNFRVRDVYSDGVNDRDLYRSSGTTLSPACRVVPVVTLNTNIQTTGRQNGVWQLKLEETTPEISYYGTLAVALQNAKDGSTIKPLTSKTETIQAQVPEGKALALNMNAQNITLDGITLTNNGLLTIKGESGEISSTVDTITNNGTLTTNGNISITTSSTNIAIKNEGNVTAQSGTITGGTYGIYGEAGNVIASGANIGASAAKGIGICTVSGSITASAGTITCGTTSSVSSGKETGATCIRTATGSVLINGATLTGKRVLVKSGEGTILMTSGNVTPLATVPIILEKDSNASLTIRGGTLETTNASIINNYSTGTITIGTPGNTSVENPTIYGRINGSVLDENATLAGPINVYSGNLIGTTSGVIRSKGNVTISGGNLQSAENSSGYTVISNAETTDATVTVTGGTIHGTGGIDVTSASAVITGGNITATTMIGVYTNTGNITVQGGNITSQAMMGVYSIDGNIVIGTNEQTPDVKTDSPIIIGETYGAYVENNTSSDPKLSFFDGTIKGKTKAINYPEITIVPTDYQIQTTLVDSYQTSILIIGNYEEVTSTGSHVNYYGTLVDAMANVTSGNTVKVVNTDLIETTQPVLLDNKTAVLDLNGKTVNLSGVLIQNESGTTLKITDSVGNGILRGTGTVISTSGAFETYGDNEFIIESTSTIRTTRLLYIAEGATATLNTGVIQYANAITESGTSGRYLVDIRGLLIINGATLQAVAGNDTYDRGMLLYDVAARLVVNSGKIQTDGYVINVSTATGATVNDAAVTITGGDIISNNNYGIYNQKTGLVYITGGNLTGTTGVYNTTSGSVKVEGTANITGTTALGLRVYTGKATILGGTISAGTNGIYVTTGSVAMSGGTIESINHGISCTTGSVTITGGTITAGTSSNSASGVYVSGAGTITIGTNEETPSVKTDSPSITGSLYGVNIVSSATINFYDGIIKGKTLSIYGIVNAMPTGYTLLIGADGDYKTATLTNDFENNYEEVTSSGAHVNYYGSLAAAFSNTASGNTVKVVGEDITETVRPELTYNKTAILDLNGKTVTMENLISVLSGATLQVVDTAGNGILQRPSNNLFSNSGTLKIGTQGNTSTTSPKLYGRLWNYNNLQIYSGLVTSNTVNTISNNKNVTISGGLITNTYSGTDSAYTILNNNRDTIDGTSTVTTNITVTGGEIQGAKNNTSYAITTTYAYTNGYINISGGTIANMISNAKGETIVSGGTINGYILTQIGSVMVTGGTINSPIYGITATTGTITIGTKDGTVSTTSPSITAATYGVQITSTGTLNFYDGVIKGKTAAITGVTPTPEDGYSVNTVTSGDYKVATLVAASAASEASETSIEAEDDESTQTVLYTDNSKEEEIEEGNVQPIETTE